MDKKEKILMGYSIEFNRMNMDDNGAVSVLKYLNFNGIPFCHRNTYEKLAVGEYTRDDLYYSLLEKLNLNYKYDKELLKNMNDTYTRIKGYIEFFDYDNLKEEVVNLRQIYKNYDNVYPHCIDTYFIEKIYDFYIHHKLLNEQDVNIINSSINVVYSSCRVILVHMLYFDCHRKDALKSSLKNTIEKLPLIDREELLYSLIITREMIYEKEFALALDYAKRMEQQCIKTNNLSRLCEVYQDLIAIHSNDGEEDTYILKLKELIQDKNVHLESVKRSEYYLGMCTFNSHQFEDALLYLKRRVIESIQENRFSVEICYLSVISFLKMDNDIFKVKDLDFNKMNSSNKIFFRYFIYKEEKDENFLVDYILNKILPILNGDFGFEAYIFKQELYLMKAWKEIEVYNKKIEKMNYVIMHHWEEAFKSM